MTGERKGFHVIFAVQPQDAAVTAEKQGVPHRAGAGHMDIGDDQSCRVCVRFMQEQSAGCAYPAVRALKQDRLDVSLTDGLVPDEPSGVVIDT